MAIFINDANRVLDVHALRRGDTFPVAYRVTDRFDNNRRGPVIVLDILADQFAISILPAVDNFNIATLTVMLPKLDSVASWHHDGGDFIPANSPSIQICSVVLGLAFAAIVHES